MNLAHDNPVKKITIPKPKQNLLGNEKDNFFNKEALNEFLNILDNYGNLKKAVFLRLLVISGARTGEILGLEWQSVDFENNYISISQTLTRGKYRRLYLEAPKTTSSKREVPLDKQTMDLLKRWRLQQRKELLTFGHNSISKDLNYKNVFFRSKSLLLTQLRIHID